MSPCRYVSAAVIVLAGLAVASPALAHIDPEPAYLQGDGDGSGELNGPAQATQIVNPIAAGQPAQTAWKTAVTTPKAIPPSSVATTTESPTSVSTSDKSSAINGGESQGRDSNGSLVFAFTIAAVLIIGVIVAVQSRRSLR